MSVAANPVRTTRTFATPAGIVTARSSVANPVVDNGALSDRTVSSTSPAGPRYTRSTDGAEAPKPEPVGAAPRTAIRSSVVSVQREGGCACGAVRYRLTSDPLFTNCCHCLNCQRQTGSAFVINLLIETDRVELLTGAPQPVDVPRDEGPPQRIFRCPTCQLAVFSEYGNPRVKFVRGGTLDEPSSVAPDAHIYTRSKVPWLTLPDAVPAFDEYYESKDLWPAASLERLRAVLAPPDSSG